MSYESNNYYYSNNTIQTQHMMMNAGSNSNQYNGQSQMPNQYHSYPSASHQTYTSYSQQSAYPDNYMYQQPSRERNYYNGNHVENAMIHAPRGPVTYNNSYASPSPHPSLKQQNVMYGNNNAIQYPVPKIPVADVPCPIPKSSSNTSMSTYVPDDDIESSNSSFSDNLSITNEKSSQKRPIASVEIFSQLREMGTEPERSIFVDRLQNLWEEYHIICRKLPSISHQTIDLYRLYVLIREQNGFEQFSQYAKNRHWCNIGLKLNIPKTSTTAFVLKQKYIKLKLFHYECKYDRDGIDPEPILAKIEQQKQIATPPQQVPVSTNNQISTSKSDTVESTTIVNNKRRKLTSKDIPSVNPTKLLMSLRGGLLAETTWALDTINIMLNDDQTHNYFRLKQIPGLLSAIVDIYVKCLEQLFQEFKIIQKKSTFHQTNEKNEEDSIIYRIEANCLNKYKNKQQQIVYENVYDNQGNMKDDPEHVIDLQNMDDLCYIQTHFDPLQMDEIPPESDQVPIIPPHSDNDKNKEFLERYQRKFQSDDNLASNEQQISSILFSQYSFGYNQISSRCICLSSILRNLSFISGNDLELIENQYLIHLLSRILLLRHDLSDNFFECLINIRENTLVTLANISGILILDKFDSNLIHQLIDGLLYWSTCRSSDCFSSQCLAIEILTKLSIHDMNIDFLLATSSFYRIESLINILIDWLNVDYNNQSQREFAIVLLNAFLESDSNIIHSIKSISYFISLLIHFLEEYELKTNELISNYGLDYILNLINQQQTDEIFFTTNNMLKRTVNCLLLITMNFKTNINLIKKYENRILNLSISNVIHPTIGKILTDILHYCSIEMN